MSSVTISTTECGVDHPSRSRSGDITRTTGDPAGADPPKVEVGDADRVDVVDLAVVDVLLGQFGVVQGEELTEHLVVRATDGGELTEPVERLGHVGMGLHGQPPAPTTLSEHVPLLAAFDSTCSAVLRAER